MARDLATDDLLIEQGEPAMEAYLIIGGRAEILLNDVKIAEVGEGDIVGEAALFKGSNYGASVRAVTPLTVQPITPDILDEKIKACDPMLRALIRMMMIRLRKTNQELGNLRNSAV